MGKSMSTEFDDSQHYGFFLTGTTLTSQTGKYVRQSALTLAAMRASGMLDNLVDGVTPPVDTSKLWLDKNDDPPVFKEYDQHATAWSPMTFDRMFARFKQTPLTVTGGTANAIVVSQPEAFIPNHLYSLVPTLSNTGTPTITVSGVGTFDVVYPDGQPVTENELIGGAPKALLFANGRFEVVFSTSGIYEALLAAIPEPVSFSFVGDGVGPYDTGVPIGNLASIIVTINGRVMDGGFTFDGSTFTFDTAAPTSEDKVFGWVFAARTIGVPSDGTVGDDKLDSTALVGKVIASWPQILPVYEISSSGDQTAKFPTLEAQISGFNVDMGSVRVPVTEWQTGNRYRNGQFEFKGVGVPTEGTYRFRSFRLTDSALNAHWAQDKAHVGPRGRICVPYVEGSGHHAADNKLLVKYSVDRGSTWSAPECIYRAETGYQTTRTGDTDRITCMSAGVSLGGRQVFNIQKHETDTTDPENPVDYETYELWHRKMPDHRKFGSGDGVTATTFSGQPKLRIYITDHGFVTGDDIIITSLVLGTKNISSGEAFNNVTLAAAAVTVTNANRFYFEFTTDTNANADQSGIATTCTVQNGWGDFTRVDVTSDLETAYTAVWGDLPAGDFNYHHSFATMDDGTIVACMSTNDGLNIVKYASLYSISPVIVSMGFAAGEGTILNCGSGRFCGFTRGADVTGADNDRSNFWWSDDSLVTFNHEQVRPDDTKGGQTWDEPTPLTLCNGRVLAARCERTDDPLKERLAQQASMKIYLLEAAVDDIFTMGVDAFTFTEMGRAYWTGARSSQSGPNVGVGSWVTIPTLVDATNTALEDGTPQYERAIYFFGSEMETITGFNGEWSYGQIYGIEVIDNRMPQRALMEGGGADGGTAERLDVRRYKTASDIGLNTGWTPSKGTYQTAEPDTTPVDLTDSVDFKGGGITYARDRNGLVTIWGRIDGSGSAGNPAFTIERELAPATDKQFLVPAGAAKQDRTGGVTLVVTVMGVNSAAGGNRGAVYIDRQANAGLGGAISDISLDGLTWLADGDTR
jgi:hypothetical protein